MSDPLKYTIGWICPIDKTFVAARAFLEEIHEPPVVVSQRDNNSYVLGRVSGHNVVIASVSGEYGTASAAGVTRDTILSFPNIRFYLMVGIGSGAPSAKHDIRLGDVVVGNRGVFQYDFRETIQNQTFVETGSLDQPPTSLLEALSTLEATYDLHGQQLDDNIKDIIKRHPRLRKTYSRPSASSDRLYKPSVCHAGPGEPCSEVCGDDVSLLELRSERKEDEDNPAIHYGKIGTSNQLIEDALIRDQLAAEREVLCFEIEAAGLMSHLPCLVIRGICDYADSHKNGKWHGYAAMAAAAYAKDLLCPIPPGVIERETSVNEVLADRSGKTVLTTTILDNLSQMDHHTALRFFFDFNDTRKQSTDAMCRSLAFQLYIQQEAPRKVLYELFALHDNGKKQPETEELSECLRAMLQVSAKVYIVLDALDECVDKTELLKWIQGFVSSPHLQNVQLLATSRPEEEFRRGIRKFIGDRNYITLDESSVNEDIRTYIGNRMEQSPVLKRWTLASEELEEIQNKVGERSGGQFRWAACQFDTLERNLTPGALRSMLDDPPQEMDGSPQEMDDSPQKTLSRTYDRIILDIPPEFKSDVLRLLQFLVHAERPVTLAEAVDHISTQTENGQVDIQRRILVGENIQSYCPLISVIETLQDGKSIREVHLAHSSAKDYLIRRSEFQLAPNTASVAFAESYGPSSVASQIFSEEAVSTKLSSLEEDVSVVVENHATRQMAKTFYSHKHIKSSCDDINDDIRSLASGPEDIQSQDGSNSTRWAVKEAAANYLADMLINNPKLGPLYEEALKGLNDARFVRNHGRLLKRYYLSLLSQAPSQKQGAAVDFLRPRSHRTLISSKILVHMGREIVPVTLPQDYERNLILERFLNKVNETPVAPNTDEGDGTESSEDEYNEEDFHQGLSFVDLEDAKSYFVSGTPLMQFETEFRDFLHPSCKVAIETQEETQSQAKKETEQETIFLGL
ncbi:Vegetative incompatibility protein HET-E-1 [Colletotrichum viniferum]|nr:Vegetative incompatibility protein HET-E-1 [Colletotrichum viniferum]